MKTTAARAQELYEDTQYADTPEDMIDMIQRALDEACDEAVTGALKSAITEARDKPIGYGPIVVIAMLEDMERIDQANRRVEDMLNRATADTRAIRDIVTKWMFHK